MPTESGIVWKGKRETARVLGVSEATVDIYLELGLPARKSGRGYRFNLEVALLWKNGFDAGTRRAEARLEQDKADVLEYDPGETLREQLLKLKAERQLAEHKLVTAQGEWVERDEAREVYERRLKAVRGFLLAFPTRFAPQLAPITETAAMTDVLGDIMHEVMTELSSAAADELALSLTDLRDLIVMDHEVTDPENPELLPADTKD